MRYEIRKKHRTIDIDKDTFEKAYNRCLDGDISKTDLVKELNISWSTLYRLIDKYILE